MKTFVKLGLVLLLSQILQADQRTYGFSFQFSDADTSIHAIAAPSYISPVSQLENVPSLQYNDLYPNMDCIYGVQQDDDGNLVCIGENDIWIDGTTALQMNVYPNDSTEIADDYNAITYASNNMISNQNAFTVKEVDNGGQCVPNQVNNHQPQSLSFYVALDVTFALANGDWTTCETLMVGMQHANAKVYTGGLQKAVVYENTDDDDEEVQYENTENSEEKEGTMGKSIKKIANDVDKTINSLECSGDIWWMTRAASPYNSRYYGSDLTVYPYQAPDWLGLNNQYFINSVQCSNNYTMFFTHDDTSGDDLASSQVCSSSKNRFIINFAKTVQGGYN